MVRGLAHYYDAITGLTIVNCFDKPLYQDLYLFIEGPPSFSTKILVDDYMIPYSQLYEDATGEYSDVCIIVIVDDFNADYWTLGTTFFKDNYVSFILDDPSAAEMHFGPNAESDGSRDLFMTFPNIPE